MHVFNFVSRNSNLDNYFDIATQIITVSKLFANTNTHTLLNREEEEKIYKMERKSAEKFQLKHTYEQWIHLYSYEIYFQRTLVCSSKILSLNLINSNLKTKTKIFFRNPYWNWKNKQTGMSSFKQIQIFKQPKPGQILSDSTLYWKDYEVKQQQ